MANEVITAILIDDDASLTFVEVCQQYNLSESMLRQMSEHGLFPEEVCLRIKATRFDALKLARVHSAARLQQDLGVNVPGVVLALELLDELQQLRQEVRILQRHIQES